VAVEPAIISPGMTIGDIYYVIFRQKWKIILCSLAGFVAAFAIYKLHPPAFESEAKLFISYIVTPNKAVGPVGGDDATLKSPDQRGETIMDSEAEIMGSLDLAKQVAEAIGPEKILASSTGGRDLNRAAMTIKSGLTIESLPKSSVMRILFRDHDPEIVQPILREIIDRYLKMHVEVHRPVGIVGDFLTQETDQMRARLTQTEDELRKAKSSAGIITLDDSKKTYSEQISHLQGEIFAVQAQIAEQATDNPAPVASTIAAATQVGAPAPAVPPDQLDAYRTLSFSLETLHRNELELLSQYTEGNPRVVEIRGQIAKNKAARDQLLKQYPELAKATVPTVATAEGYIPAPVRPADQVSVAALQAKVKVLVSQLAQVHAETANLERAEGEIDELQRRKDLEEANYKYYSASLEQSRINEALGTGRVSNISQIQTPSPPFKDTAKYYKILGGIAGGGVGIGLAWAFALEMMFDRTVRRPSDIEKTVGVPLFLSIPQIGKKGRSAALREAALHGKDEAAKTVGTDLAIRNGMDELQAFHETLRDRLIGYFESKGMIQKPKLVAVTGLGRDSGITTTAAGLARSLSETGDGNVLLVDMTKGQGSSQQFYGGKPTELEDIFSTRGNAQVQDKLYVVSEEPGTDRLSRILPQRFTKLIPKLKASDFDYIIFDMPPVSQLSVTPRLAGFMDMVLLVVESEKTDREVVKRATSLLEESNAHVGILLNKTRSYVPAKLHQEFLLNG
jgi:polysaccharide biosynthesis transport protein